MAGVLANNPKKGDVYLVDFDADPNQGYEQNGYRPAVIISTDGANSRLPVVTIAAITSQIRDEKSPIALVLEPGDPLEKRSSIMAFQVRTIDKARLKRFIGPLRPEQIEQLNEKLRFTWGLQ